MTAVISASLIIKLPIFLYLKNQEKGFGTLCAQYDHLTLICEQSGAKSKYGQMLALVVQALVKPSEPLAREEKAFRSRSVCTAWGLRDLGARGNALFLPLPAGRLLPPSAHPELEMGVEWE